jgi:large subunit ribosomal protein L25
MDFVIKADKREAGKPELDRAQDLIPSIVYGPEIDPISISVQYQDFIKLLAEAGESSLINCEIEGVSEPIVVLIQDIQHDPVKGKVTHVDFRQIKLGENLETPIVLAFVGESDAVKSAGGTLIRSLDEVNVKCLPRHLVSHIDVDLSKLASFDDIIHIGDLVLPEGITITDDPKTVVAKVSAPLTDEQIKAMEEEGAKGVESVQVEGAVEGAEAGDKAVATEEGKPEEGKKEGE